MSSRKESLHIPIVDWLFKLLHKIKIPGFEGMNLYDLLEMYISGIVKGALTSRAGSIAFSFFIALFPFALVVLTLIPFVPIEGFQDDFMSIVFKMLPSKEASDAVSHVLNDIANNKYGELLSFGFILAIFLMTNGVNAVFGGFEYSYHIKETRNVVRAYLISLAVSLVMALFLLVTVALTVFYKIGLDALFEKGWVENELFWLQIGRGFLFVIMIFTTVSMLYRFGTKTGKHSRFFSPGAVFTTTLSILTFYLFSYYVTEFAKYNELYGAIGTLLILMLFVWLNAIILLLGFELNASIYSLRTQNKIKEVVE